jgi:hypothetical protein
VINLVIAAREVFEAPEWASDEWNSLDKALEAFSERVPYENETDDTATAQEEPAPNAVDTAEIAALRAENERLRKALEPFAKAPYMGANAFNRAALSDQDFRRARAAIAPEQEEAGE